MNEEYLVEEGDMEASFDLRDEIRLDAGLNIAKTIFVCIVLTLGALFFTRDANDLVIIPIEKMIDMVKNIARNPIAATEYKSSTVYDVEELHPGCWNRFCSAKDEKATEYET